jgi:1-aminocyclopropane-1-carboxylate deaminase/D-cysteine desulfhydrase-like pyridoxal-dependent ACC family enzyme
VPLALFRAFPGLAGSLAHVGLAELPTPVEPMDGLAAHCSLRAGRLWVKRDDLTATTYGGNKVRKLEFTLGEALEHDATDVVTFGAAGSNHALATAVHAGALGMRVHLVLADQPNAHYVARNLRAGLAAGAEYVWAESEKRAIAVGAQLAGDLRDAGRSPYVLPFGGSTPHGDLGFVSAAFELAEQVAGRDLPEPDLLYIPAGSMGSCAGLVAGLRLAGLKTRVVCCRVLPAHVVTPQAVLEAVRSAAEVLSEADPAIPAPDPRLTDFDLRAEGFGQGYALFTAAGQHAVREARERVGLELEGTYSGKAMAVLADDARSGRLDGRTVLFWDTYNSRPLPVGEAADELRLPPELAWYLDAPVQALDEV